MKVLNFKMNPVITVSFFQVICGITRLDPRSCFGFNNQKSSEMGPWAAKLVGALVFRITVLWFV